MYKIRCVKSVNEILPDDKWKKITTFKDNLFKFQGRSYQVIELRERDLSYLERVGRISTGLVLVICTLSLALFSKSVRELFSQTKESMGYVKDLQDNSHIQNFSIDNQLALKLFSRIPTKNLSTASTNENKNMQILSVDEGKVSQPSGSNPAKHLQTNLTDKSDIQSNLTRTKVLNFFEEKVASKPKLEKKLPVSSEKMSNFTRLIENFKKEALNSLNKPQQAIESLKFDLTSEQKNKLLEANRKKYYLQDLPSGCKIVRGGCNFVIFLDNVPNFVFKPMEDKETAEKYIRIVQTAQQTVLDKELHLLHIPQTKLLELNGKFFIMQEKADLMFSEFYDVKGVYTYCWRDEEAKNYIITVFKQLLEFINDTKFADVKYDNLPISFDGKVNLIDLDDRSNFSGLVAGGEGKKYGLFNYIPYEYLDEFLSFAKEKLNEELYQYLSSKVKVIKETAKIKGNKLNEGLDYYRKNEIVCPSQLLNTELISSFKDKKKQALAAFLIEEINKNLVDSQSFSLQEGRTFYLEIKPSHPISIKAKEIWGDDLILTRRLNEVTLYSLLEEILEELKKAEYIYKFKFSPSYPLIKIVC